jgi:hypothetical protein
MALGLQQVEAPRMSKQTTYESGEVFSSMHWLPLPPRNIPGTHFCQMLRQTQGHSAAIRITSTEIPMTP